MSAKERGGKGEQRKNGRGAGQQGQEPAAAAIPAGSSAVASAELAQVNHSTVDL